MNLMIKNIKEVHNTDICLFRIGNFYHTYGKDAKIIAYIFDYKIKQIDGNNNECGFPLVAINKVKSKLEKMKLNYLIIDRRNNYDVEEFSDNKDLNSYILIYEKANKFINLKIRVQNINDYLNDNLNEEKTVKLIREIESLIYERREI